MAVSVPMELTSILADVAAVLTPILTILPHVGLVCTLVLTIFPKVTNVVTPFLDTAPQFAPVPPQVLPRSLDGVGIPGLVRLT